MSGVPGWGQRGVGDEAQDKVSVPPFQLGSLDEIQAVVPEN